MPLLEASLRGPGHRVQCLTIEAPPESWRAEIRTAFDLAAGVARAVRSARGPAHSAGVVGQCGPAAIGCVAGAEADPAVCWFDAHGDFTHQRRRSAASWMEWRWQR